MALVVIKHPGFIAEVHDVDLSTIGFLRSVVGGSIELVRLSNEWDMWVNEEGKLLNLEPNLLFPRDIVVGSVVVTGHSGENTVGLKGDDVEQIKITLDARAVALEIAIELQEE